MSLLNESQINDNLKKLNGWEFKNNTISTSFSFSSYMRGIDFVNSIASLAEKENHHPDIKIGWCMVNIEFTSHDPVSYTHRRCRRRLRCRSRWSPYH